MVWHRMSTRNTDSFWNRTEIIIFTFSSPEGFLPRQWCDEADTWFSFYSPSVNSSFEIWIQLCSLIVSLLKWATFLYSDCYVSPREECMDGAGAPLLATLNNSTSCYFLEALKCNRPQCFTSKAERTDGEVDGQSVLPWHNRWCSAQLVGEAQARCVCCVVAATAAPQGCANRWLHRCSTTTTQRKSILVSHTSIQIGQCVVDSNRFKLLITQFSISLAPDPSTQEWKSPVKSFFPGWLDKSVVMQYFIVYVNKGRVTHMFEIYVLLYVEQCPNPVLDRYQWFTVMHCSEQYSSWPFIQCAMKLHSELLLLAPAVRIRRSLTDAMIIRQPVIQTACVHLL